MAFNIIWSDFAEGQLDAIFEYYSENAGLNVAKRILQKIIAEPDKIITHPEISQKEEFLVDRGNDYRYLVCDNYKIIYCIDYTQEYIKIADVFDTRQNPVKLKRNR